MPMTKNGKPIIRTSVEMGQRVQQLRLALGFGSAASFARALGWPTVSVRRLEAGTLNGSRGAMLLVAIAQAVPAVSLDWIITGRRYPEPREHRVPKLLLIEGGRP
jgi:hypothetical protein